MELIIYIFGLIVLYAVILLAINHSNLVTELKHNNQLMTNHNKLLKEIRDRMKKDDNDPNSGRYIDEQM